MGRISFGPISCIKKRSTSGPTINSLFGIRHIGDISKNESSLIFFLFLYTILPKPEMAFSVSELVRVKK